MLGELVKMMLLEGFTCLLGEAIVGSLGADR